MILHEGGFHTGSIFRLQLDTVAGALRDHGYYVLIATYRLAPCDVITGQTCHDESTQAGKDSGRPTQQVNDIKSLVRAARADGKCNGFLGIVGGSAGATHAAWVAIDQTESLVWPVWNSTLRPDCVVCLSGAYDFGDETDPGYETITGFEENIENYTDTCDPRIENLYAPVTLLAGQPTDIKPMLLVNSMEDLMPFSQIGDMVCALERRGVSSTLYQTLSIPGSDHAFDFWYDWDGGIVVPPNPTLTVATHAVAFLDQNLKPPP
ncbi:MAG: alpha/beta hydrolase family protein [Chthoniobacterales bacterium]